MRNIRKPREKRTEGSPEVSFHEHGTLVFNEWKVTFHVKRGADYQNPCAVITATHEGRQVYFLDFRKGILEKVEAFEAGKLLINELRVSVETYCYAKVFRKEKGGKPYFYVTLQNSPDFKKSNKPITPRLLAQYCC